MKKSNKKSGSKISKNEKEKIEKAYESKDYIKVAKLSSNIVNKCPNNVYGYIYLIKGLTNDYNKYLENDDLKEVKDIFDKVYPSHFIHLRKPDLRFYRYVAEQEGVNPSQCFFTDDIKENVDAGREVGMSSFQYIDAEKLERDLKEVGVL